MPVEVVEKFESRLVTTGANPSVELRYAIRGTNDDVEARGALVTGSPTLYDPWGSGLLFLPRDTVSIQPVGDLLWEGIVRYGTVPQTNESVFSFDTGGGAQHITQSLANVARYAPAGQTAPNFKGAIGVTADSVEGVDITVPVYHFAETHYLADAVVTLAYKLTLFALTGRVNNSAFKGFAAGECLFLGAAGTKRGSGDWEIGFRFASSPNVTGLTVGDITGINKKDSHYLWVGYEPKNSFHRATTMINPRTAPSTPSTIPQIASPSPFCLPPDRSISPFAIDPRINATTPAGQMQNATSPSTRAAIALPFVGTSTAAPVACWANVAGTGFGTATHSRQDGHGTVCPAMFSEKSSRSPHLAQ